jgi:hypothetical protein
MVVVALLGTGWERTIYGHADTRRMSKRTARHDLFFAKPAALRRRVSFNVTDSFIEWPTLVER